MDKVSSFLLNKKTGKTRLILLYRYLSLAMTSAFYLISQPFSPILFKIGVISTLLVAAIIVKDLLLKNEKHPVMLKWIIVTETVGITLLLLPTGGIESPFIWYAMNPVLVAASYLSGFFCWGLLILYMTAASVLSNALFMNMPIHFPNFLNQNSYLFLVFILITILFQLFSKLTNELHSQAKKLEEQQKKLVQANEELVFTNEKSNESLEHIMSLYQTIEFFLAQENVHRLVKTMLDFTAKLTKTPTAFCWLSDVKQGKTLFSSNNGRITEDTGKQLVEGWADVEGSDLPFRLEIQDKIFQVVAVQSTTYRGFIGVESQKDFITSEGRLLKFLADLSSVILERLSLKEASDQFLIVEEQNRIANEIHDSVSQRVFGLVFGLHSLKRKLEVLPKHELLEEIQCLSDSASMAMKELRSSIYQLSTKKRGETLLFSKISEFLNDAAKLNDVTVHSHLQGDEEIISYKLKKMIYRIICEASGNAIRHGKCKNVHVSVQITNQNTELAVVDDGIGFEASNQSSEQSNGLGLNNMKNLVKSFGGKIEITSKFNQGTRVGILLPLDTPNKEVVGL